MTDGFTPHEKDLRDIWIYVQHGEGSMTPETFGLIAEARRINAEMEGQGIITAVILGAQLEAVSDSLKNCGADRILFINHDSLALYNGELFSRILFRLIEKYHPAYFLMTQASINADLSSRLAALTETALVTRVVDLTFDEERRCVAIRPIHNGHLFERLIITTGKCPIICFMPSVLSVSAPVDARKADFIKETADFLANDLRIKIKNVIEADPEVLDIKEADIIVAGGRGAGRGDSFNIIYELARAIGGVVGGTRPVIDWQVLPFERQIGQTGKTVLPRLLIACGISGANEFTAGMENSGLVVAVNNDPNARIFQFADIGIIGDIHEIVPLLIEGIKKLDENA